TCAPILRPTPSPAASIRPTISCPGTIGSLGLASSPSTTCRSVRHTPQASTLMRTCPGPGAGSGRFSIVSRSWGQWRTMARMETAVRSSAGAPGACDRSPEKGIEAAAGEGPEHISDGDQHGERQREGKPEEGHADALGVLSDEDDQRGDKHHHDRQIKPTHRVTSSLAFYQAGRPRLTLTRSARESLARSGRGSAVQTQAHRYPGCAGEDEVDAEKDSEHIKRGHRP